ncbi:MAG: S1 RNA-binding domain-containing protein [Candidatus Sungbacteria bacterium]|nr:S1 RNA-binding domain-containing protein [Candidatus Sungbacteria bacterium]
MDAILKRGAQAQFLKAGDLVDGELMEKKGTRIFFDLGPSGVGILFGREFYAAHEILKNLKPGDRITAKVVEPDNDEGYVELSLQEAGREKRWRDLKQMMREGTALELSPSRANTGGLIIEHFGVEGFLPASQLSLKNYPRVEGGDKEKIFQELQKLVGSLLKVKILDVDQDEQKLIFTEKGIDQEAIRQILGGYKVGDVVEGEITGVVDFGAFMRFDTSLGIEGLIHLSEIDWILIENPRDVLKPGDLVRAKIIDIQGDKVSLSLKQLKEDPWMKIAEKYKKGDRVTGKITKFNSFGAFVQFENDVQGLAHVSEFGSERAMREKLTRGEEHSFRVLLIDPKEHRMSLGVMREEKSAPAASEPAPEEGEKT